MSALGLRTIGKATSERVLGLGPGKIRSAVAAFATGTATAVVTYRLLRGKSLTGSDE
jgi:hypothetical protein